RELLFRRIAGSHFFTVAERIRPGFVYMPRRSVDARSTRRKRGGQIHLTRARGKTLQRLVNDVFAWTAQNQPRNKNSNQYQADNHHRPRWQSSSRNRWQGEGCGYFVAHLWPRPRPRLGDDIV